jgi:hypothetical protein
MSCGRSLRFRAMTGTEPKTTLRKFREYFASSYEALGKLAARIGVTHPTLADVLANSRALARLWLKIKSRPQQEFVACGFNEGKGSRKYFGVLLLAAYRNGKLGLIRFGALRRQLVDQPSGWIEPGEFVQRSPRGRQIVHT